MITCMYILYLIGVLVMCTMLFYDSALSIQKHSKLDPKSSTTLFLVYGILELVLLSFICLHIVGTVLKS